MGSPAQKGSENRPEQSPVYLPLGSGRRPEGGGSRARAETGQRFSEAGSGTRVAAGFLCSQLSGSWGDAVSYSHIHPHHRRKEHVARTSSTG